MSLSLGFSMELLQIVSTQHMVPGWVYIGHLSPDQMEDLAIEMVENAERGLFDAMRSARGEKGNLMQTRFFRERAGAMVDESPSRPRYVLDARLTVSSDVAKVRDRIVEVFSRLRRNKPAAKPENAFSHQFLKQFDYVTSVRHAAVSHAVDHQREFVEEPYNPMKLNELRQEDIATAIGCHTTTISRLLRNVMIRFPDTIERDVATLVPGRSLSFLQGCYGLGMLARNSEYFDVATKTWLVDDEILRRELQSQYGIDVKPRTVRKYKLWMDENIFRSRRSSQKAIPVDVKEGDEG